MLILRKHQINVKQTSGKAAYFRAVFDILMSN